jgi:trans-aconitate methyltransferase
MTASAGWDPNLYNAKHSFVWKLAEDVFRLLSPQAGERILDIGCGTGQLTSQIAASGALVTGIDSSAEMIRQAREKYPNLRFEVGDARDIHVAETLDAVFSNAALHWIREPERVAASVWRVLAPGGRFVAEFGGKGNIRSVIGAFRRAFPAMGMTFPEDANPWYYPSVGEYAQLLEAHGFEVNLAELFDRPTPLEDGERGLENWARMFAGSYLARIAPEKLETFLREVERQSRAALFHNGEWVLDYRRIRVRAFKPLA